MASIRKSDGRIWLEKGEFRQLDSFIRRTACYEPAGVADNYIIMKTSDNVLYVPINDAKHQIEAVPACLPAIEYKEKQKQKEEEIRKIQQDTLETVIEEIENCGQGFEIIIEKIRKIQF